MANKITLTTIYAFEESTVWSPLEHGWQPLNGDIKKKKEKLKRSPCLNPLWRFIDKNSKSRSWEKCVDNSPQLVAEIQITHPNTPIKFNRKLCGSQLSKWIHLFQFFNDCGQSPLQSWIHREFAFLLQK